MAPPLIQHVGVQIYYLFGWCFALIVPWKFTWISASLCLGSVFVREIWVTAFYHRYFSHRSFQTSRWFQFIMGFLAETSVQQGILWWAATHRHHHHTCDTKDDPHSPLLNSLWWSHCGWVTDPSNYEPELIKKKVPDLIRFPELVLLDTFYHIPCLLYALPFLYFGGAHGWFWGCWMATWFLSHLTFLVNSATHVTGDRPFAVKGQPHCEGRNSFWVALLTCGEGWHNNHHAFAKSCRMGLEWWQIDVTYWFIRLLECCGLVWNLHVVSAKTIRSQPRAGASGKAVKGKAVK